MELADQIARIEAQEARLVLVTFDNDDALRLGELLVGMARERGFSITIDITRGDQQLFHAAMPGTSENNDDWIARKVRSVRRFGESSLLVGLHHQAEGRPFDAQPWNDTTRFTGLGGAIPIRIAGVGVVGAVAISGLAHESDHAFAAEGLELMISNH